VQSRRSKNPEELNMPKKSINSANASLKRSSTELPHPLNDFFLYMENIKNVSPKTSDEYFYDLRMFYRFLAVKFELCKSNIPFDKIEISCITLDHLRNVDQNMIYEYIAFLNHEHSNTAKTRARKIASIRSFFKFVCIRAKLLDENPAIDIETPKLEKSLPKYLNLNDSIDLLNSVQNSRNKTSDTYANQVRDYCILTLFLNCGLRLAELISINVTDVRGDTLTVLGKGNKERTVYLNDACLTSISSHLEERVKVSNIPTLHKNALFLSSRKQRISRRSVQNLVEKYIKKAGLDPTRYTTHKLRHTAATLMFQNGVDIRALQEILGHENLGTTEIYTHVSNKQLREAVKQNPLSSVKIDKNIPNN